MKLNYYTIASLPELAWEGELKGTLAEFLEEHESIFSPYMENITLLMLYSEIRNIELGLKALRGEEHAIGSRFLPTLVSEEELVNFLEMPFVNLPDAFPEYFADYFHKYRETDERLAHIDELYVECFHNLQLSSDPFISFFGDTLSDLKTILMAYRLRDLGLSLDDHLVGDEDMVSFVLNHRGAADFSLKAVFPGIVELQSILESGAVQLEKELDLFVVKLLSDYKEEDTFGDHVIYLYVISLFLRDRWCLLDAEKGNQILEEILQG